MSDSNALGKGFWDDVTALVWQQLDPVLDYLAQQMLEGDEVVGDHPFQGPTDEIAHFVDLVQTGAMDHLPVVSPPVAEHLTKRFSTLMGKQIEGATNG